MWFGRYKDLKYIDIITIFIYLLKYFLLWKNRSKLHLFSDSLNHLGSITTGQLN